MFNFDLLETRAGQDIFNEGKAEGKEEGMRQLIINTLKKKFGKISKKVLICLNRFMDQKS